VCECAPVCARASAFVLLPICTLVRSRVWTQNGCAWCVRCASRIRSARRYAHFLSVFNSIDTDKYPPDQHLHPQPTKHPPRAFEYSHPACPNYLKKYIPSPHPTLPPRSGQHCRVLVCGCIHLADRVCCRLPLAIPTRVRPCDSFHAAQERVNLARRAERRARRPRRRALAPTAGSCRHVAHARPRTACVQCRTHPCGCERQTSVKAVRRGRVPC
jgi:hypothetical protein